MLQVGVVKSGNVGDDGEWADLVEIFDILVHLDMFQRLVNLLDVFNELSRGLVLTSSIEISIVMMEEEGLGALEVFFLVVVVFENVFQMVGFSTVGWSSDGTILDFLKDSIEPLRS